VRLAPAHSCRRCNHWIEGDWPRATPEQRKALEAQMNGGECGTCQQARLHAAEAFIWAIEAVRQYERAFGPGMAPQPLRDRVAAAGDALTRAGLNGPQTRPSRNGTVKSASRAGARDERRRN